MSSRKRKPKFPEKKSEEKRAKMTWSMTDLAKSVSDESRAQQFILPPLRQEKAATRRRRVESTTSTGVPANLELKLENTYSKQNICQLGCFSICLCTSKEQEDEMRMNGTNVSSAHLVNEWNFDHRNYVIVRLAFETPISSTTSPEIRDCCDHGSTSQDEVDILKQVSFKATVPNVKDDQIEAIVYLQNKGVISLVLKPEQGILKDNWEVVVCLNKIGLCTLSLASVEPTSRKIDKFMKILMSWFYDSLVDTDLIEDNERGLTADKGFSWLFDSIKAVQKKASSAAANTNKRYCVNDSNNKDLVVPDAQHPDLKPVLRGYQRKAVEWMLGREYGCCLGEHIADDNFTHPLWREIRTLDGKLVYFNPHTGRVTKKCFPPPLLPLGGILADEMGLGKTVEVIACILCHPKPTSESKLLVDVESGTALQKLSNPQMIVGESLLSSCKMRHEKPTTAQIDPSRHQALSNSSTMNPEHKSESASHGTTMHSSLASESVNANKAFEHKLLKNNGSSKLTECVTSSKRTNCVVTHSDMKFLNHDKNSDVKECLNVEFTSPCVRQIRQNIHAPQVKLDQCCDVSDQQGSVSSQIASSFCKVAEDSCEVEERISKENNISVLNDINYNAASSVCLDNEKFEMFNKENNGTLLPHAVISSCESLESSRDVFQCHSNDKGRLQPEVMITQHSHNPNTNHRKDTVPSKNNQDFADNSSLSSRLAFKETATIKCQCVCGVTSANFSDKLLNCCICQAVFHARCLTYHCPKEFICPPCALKQPAVPSGATLIISPAPIAQQWIDEIIRHTQPSSLKLLVYKGVATSGFILPEVLADHDVILTTYTTLRSDFYHIDQGNASDRTMRYRKRYVSLPSPLTSVLFWRICLDEAQMVESTTAKAAEVALHLQSVHRWCVTGTPIQRDLSDIYGLLLFLGVDPYCNQTWWKTLLYEPYRQGKRQPLCNLLAKILWRSTKKDVIHELQLPDQDEKVKWLTFSPVEQHFYRRQHEECARFAMRLLSHWKKTDTMLSTIDKHTVNQLLNPLLRLRQACCHPQAVRGSHLSVQKSTLTMDKLLETLISKAKYESEEAHRQLLFAFNGLAGIHLLKEEWADAVNMYRDAMRSWIEHEAIFRTDALQKLHTLYNLSDILSHHQEQCSRTLRDDKLQDEVKELKSDYTIRVNVQVTSAQENLKTVKSSTTELMKKVDFHSPWWMEVLHYASSKGLGDDLCHRIRDELSTTDMGSFGRFVDLHGLQYLLLSKLDLIESTHQNLLVGLDKLTVMPSTQMVQATAACCLRPADNSQADRCSFCEVDDIFTEYESRIFGHQGMRGVDKDQDLQADESLDWHRHGNTGGLRAESEVEKVLKVIHNFIKANKISPTAQQDGRNHLSLIEGLRKEFKFLRALWFALRERVSCLDELDMCTTRLRLQLPGEPATDDIHVIHPLQLDQQRLKFTSDRVVAQTELRKKMGQLLYLNNLAKTQTCHDGKNPDPCPVCVKPLGVQWSVFTCGHCICCQCAWVLLRQSGIGPRNRNVHVKCPLCRVPTVAQEISYVSTTRSQGDEANNDITVKGSHSTKVEAVVRTLLTIKSADSTAKCLVFSTWQDVLAVIAKALDENDINYRHITGGARQFQESLQTFKQDPQLCVLLLPLQTGSNGLNLIEATHVLLVEPALNPAHELQAVGRVHRIGQTKPTHVYRFIIRGTVESRMYSLLQSKPTGCVRTGARDSENSSLTLGDLASLFTQEEEEDEELCMTGIYGSIGPEESSEQL